MAVDRNRSQGSFPLCRQSTTNDPRDGGAYSHCAGCGFLFTTASSKRYVASYWEAEQDETLRREREDAFVRAVELVWLSQRPVQRLLDFGCGYGETVRLLREMFALDAVGVDPFGQFSETPWLRRIDLDTALDEFGDASFDAVLSVEVFEHLDDPVATTAKLATLLRPGGALPVNTATQEFLTESGPDVEHAYLEPANLGHVSIYSFDSLREVASRAGLLLSRIVARKYEVLLSKGQRSEEHPLEANVAVLGRLRPWLPDLQREYLRLVASFLLTCSGVSAAQ